MSFVSDTLKKRPQKYFYQIDNFYFSGLLLDQANFFQ